MTSLLVLRFLSSCTPGGGIFLSSFVTLAHGCEPWEALIFPSLQDQCLWPVANSRHPGYVNEETLGTYLTALIVVSGGSGVLWLLFAHLFVCLVFFLLCLSFFSEEERCTLAF